MHMADALLSPAVGTAMCAVSAGALVFSTVKLKREEMPLSKIPLMAVSGAFVFAAQMINFTIPGTGSSGHIGGGMLLSALLGPAPALITMAVVLLIQCLLFADGGLLALGCNIFNMGVIPCLIVWPLLCKCLLSKKTAALRLGFASVIGCIAGLQLGAFGVVLETQLSGITALPFGTFVLLMQPIHLAIGAVEGAVTAAVVIFVWKMRPELVAAGTRSLSEAVDGRKRGKIVVGALLALALVTGGVLSLFASAFPDGLEWSIEKVTGSTELEYEGGFHEAAAEAQEATALLPDYDFASGEGNGTSFSGIVGSLTVLAVAGAVGGGISYCKYSRRKKQTGAEKT